MERLIKRYSNRKLYDVTSSKFVTLEDIAGFIKDGWTVKVVDESTGDDITEVVLVQVLLTQVKGKKGLALFPLILHHLIKSGERTVRDFLKQALMLSFQVIGSSRSKLKELVAQLIARGRISKSEAAELEKELSEVVEKNRRIIREEMQKALTEALGKLGLADGKSLKNLIRENVIEILNELKVPYSLKNISN